MRTRSCFDVAAALAVVLCGLPSATGGELHHGADIDLSLPDEAIVGVVAIGQSQIVYDDDFEDVIQVTQCWADVHGGAGIVRVPESGNGVIVAVLGNAVATIVDGAPTFPVHLAPGKIASAGGIDFPGEPNPGAVLVTHEYVPESTDLPGPLVVVGRATYVDLCNEGDPNCYGEPIEIASYGLLPIVAPCADVSGDGLVDFDDLLAVLAAWGPCRAACLADLDGDGAVGMADLIAVLGGWGPCSSS